jgi:hypothetical protein
MTTITSTLVSPPVILYLKLYPKVQDLTTRLLDILNRHLDLTDPLSLELSLLGGDISEIILEDKLSSDVLSRLAEKVHLLRSIIINPLDRSPIEHPCIAGGKLWEKWMLHHVREIFEDVSPYEDGADLGDEKPHVFGEEFLRWVDLVFASTDPMLRQFADHLQDLRSSENRSTWLVEEEVRKERLPVLFREYTTLARNADRLNEMTRLKEIVAEGVDCFALIIRETEEKTAEKIKNTKAALKLSEELLARDLENIRQGYGRIIHSLKESLFIERLENTRLKGRVEELEGRLSTAENRIQDLSARLQSAEAQNSANWAAAHSSSGGSGCTIM